jgi:hypothetical protein
MGEGEVEENMYNYNNVNKTNSVALVRKRTIPIVQLSLVSEF